MPYFLAQALFNLKYEVVRRDINSKTFIISGQKPLLTLAIIISHFFSERWPSYFSFNHRIFANVDRFCKLFPCTVEFINIWKRWITLFLVNHFLHKQFFHSGIFQSFSKIRNVRGFSQSSLFVSFTRQMIHFIAAIGEMVLDCF